MQLKHGSARANGQDRTGVALAFYAQMGDVAQEFLDLGSLARGALDYSMDVSIEMPLDVSVLISALVSAKGFNTSTSPFAQCNS